MGAFRKTVLVGGLAVVLALPGPAPALEMRPILTSMLPARSSMDV